MRKFKIDKVKPFNDLYFRSCYYHQLLAGLKAFDINKDEVLLSFFTLIKPNFNIKEINFNEKKKFLKTRNYKIRLCNLNKEKLVNKLDKGYPIILGIDDYYLESKEVTYLKHHEPHFLLVYGYDLDRDIANVVEHDYFNDYNYKEKELSLNNILLANQKFRFISKKKRTCKVLIPKISNNKNLFKHIKNKYLINNQSNSYKNLIFFKSLICNNITKVLDFADKLSNYFGKLKEQYHLLTQTNILKISENLIDKLNELIIRYSMILSVIWKVNYLKNTSYLERNINTIIKKIDEILGLEEEIYKELYDVFKS